jgi:DNA modification methylase
MELAEKKMQKVQEENYSAKLERKSYPSVFFVNETSIFRSNYPAVFNEELARFLIEMFSDVDYGPEPDCVLDPMCGSGTIPRIAAQLGRVGIGSDINSSALDIAMKLDDRAVKCYIQCDARNLEFAKENSTDLILTSPSFGISIDAKHERYSSDPADIANSKSYEEWREKFKPCLAEFFRVLKPGHLCIIETRPRRDNWKAKPLFRWIIDDAEKEGFDYFDMIVEIQAPYSKFPQDMREMDHRKPYPQHSFVLMFQRPEDRRLL